MQSSNIEEYDRLKKKLGSLNTARKRMASLFLAKVAKKWQNDQEKGKINPRALYKTKTGNKKVFRQKKVTQDASTAISFLVDWSGSMDCTFGVYKWDRLRETRISASMMAVVLFLETLEATKIKSEVLSHTTFDFGRSLKHAFVGDGPRNYGRAMPLKVNILKSFDESLTKKVKGRIGGYIDAGLYHNCDADALEIAALRLSQRSEKRKVLFVLSDGAPEALGNMEIQKSELKKRVKKLEKAGYEIIAIAIGTNKPKRYYDNCIIIGEHGATITIAEKLLDELKKILK